MGWDVRAGPTELSPSPRKRRMSTMAMERLHWLARGAEGPEERVSWKSQGLAFIRSPDLLLNAR